MNDRLPAALIHLINAYIRLWLSACQKNQQALNVEAAAVHTAGPASLWPPSTHRLSPLNCLSYLTLHSSVCVHTLLTWISGCLLDTQSSLVLRCPLSLPSTTLKNVPTSSSSSGTHKAWGSVPWMVHSTHFPPRCPPFSLLSLIVIPCP